MKNYKPAYPNPGDDQRPEWEKKLRPLFSAAEDKDGEGARPSSLVPACKMPDPGLGYELMLMRELKITNERTVRELGPCRRAGCRCRRRRGRKCFTGISEETWCLRHQLSRIVMK